VLNEKRRLTLSEILRYRRRVNALTAVFFPPSDTHSEAIFFLKNPTDCHNKVARDSKNNSVNLENQKTIAISCRQIIV